MLKTFTTIVRGAVVMRDDEVTNPHLGEPIRNFGVGGYGVFQAYARLRRMEQTAIKTPFVILNIYDNDHERTLLPWQISCATNPRHANEWPTTRERIGASHQLKCAASAHREAPMIAK